MKKILKKYKKAIISISILVILGALGLYTYLSYQNNSFTAEKTDTNKEQAKSQETDIQTTTQPDTATKTEESDLSTFKITNISRGSTLTGATPITVFVPDGGYNLSITINSDKWGEIFFTQKDNVSGEVSVPYTFNQAVAPGQSGNVRAILLKNGIEVARNEVWVNF